MNRISTTLAAAASIVAVLGIMLLGYAAADAVRVALFAQNAARSEHQSVVDLVPGQLLALDQGQVPCLCAPQGCSWNTWRAGERGPQGAQGIPGPGRAAGPEEERTDDYRQP